MEKFKYEVAEITPSQRRIFLKFRGFPQHFRPRRLEEFQPVAFTQAKEIERVEKKQARARSFFHSRYAKPPCGASREDVERWDAERKPIRVGAREQEKWLEVLFKSIAKLVEQDPIVVGISGKKDANLAFQCALNIGYR